LAVSGRLHNLYPLPDIIREIKSGRMRWVELIEQMGKIRIIYKILVGKPKERRYHSKDVGICGRIF